MTLQNSTILITGGSGGIGLEFAKQLSQAGSQVIITGRDPNKLAMVRREFPKIQVIKSDVTKVEEIKALYSQVTQQFPKLNILINNAGISRNISFLETQNPDTLAEELDTNLRAPIQMINQFLPHLRKQPEAAIVNITSGLAFSPYPKVPIYCAAKAGLHSFTLSLRMQLKNTGVRVFEVAPPATETDMIKGFPREFAKSVRIMDVADMVAHSIDGLKTDQFEICPGQSGQLRFISRLAPGFILKQMSRNLNS